MLMLTDCRCNQGLPIPEDSGTPGAATMCSAGCNRLQVPVQLLNPSFRIWLSRSSQIHCEHVIHTSNPEAAASSL